MVSASELKTRIAGIRDTKKITDAMYMISSAKMRRALRDLEKTEPYFKAISEKIGELFLYFPDTKNRYFKARKKDESEHTNHGILLITSDKGFAGAYNHTAVKVCEEYMSHHPKTTLFVLGEYGKQYFKRKKIPYVEDFLYSTVDFSIETARRICADLLEYYNDSKLDEIDVIYTDYIGSAQGECKETVLLPLEKTTFTSGQRKADKDTVKRFVPNPETVLNGIIPSYLVGYVYGCLVESFCSEQQARMIAMKGSSDNADKMLKDLQLKYNKLRQDAITGEVTEIMAGVNARKQKMTDSISGGKAVDGQ